MKTYLRDTNTSKIGKHSYNNDMTLITKNIVKLYVKNAKEKLIQKNAAKGMTSP